MIDEAVYILTGSNSGNRQQFLKYARDKINSVAGRIVFSSHIYESEPWGFESSNAFLNQVVLINSSMTPEELLNFILETEAGAGRIRTGGDFEDRTLDIDILFYGNSIIETNRLVIPHPRLHLRRFTLAPLCEIAPYFIHPVFNKTNSELYERCEDHSIVRQL